jgi:GNAT superfamily N-acetyltransferase
VAERDDRFWAEYLGITPSDWHQPGVSIRAHEGLKGYRGVWCFSRHGRTVVSAPAGWVPYLEVQLRDVPQERLMEESFLRGLFADDLDCILGPAFQGCLSPERFRPVHSPDVRFLAAEESATIEVFRGECGQEAWDDSGLDEGKHDLAARLEGDRIVAMAGYRAWTEDAGDPCILTHPAYRGRGWGTAATSAVVERALQGGKLLLYQTLEANVAAVRIARRLGYDQYARYMAVRLKVPTPSNPAMKRSDSAHP